MKEIYRDHYLNKLRSFIKTPAITVVTGPRRVGKSVLLRQIAAELNLSEPGVYVDKESFEFDFIKTAGDLISYYKETVPPGQNRWIVIDEVQQIQDWEKAAASLNGDGFTRVVLSGSNSSLLSGDLATHIAGRYLSLPVYPLSLTEFSELYALLHPDGTSDRKELFRMYLKLGGLPGILHTDLSSELVHQMQKDIVSTIALRDIVTRYRIRDLKLFESVMAFTLDNIGNLISAKKITDFLKKERRTLSVDSVINYLRYMQDAFLIYEVPRFDIKGKKLMEINQKYYLGDIGIRNGFLGYKEKDMGGLLENLVYLELSRRGYRISIGILEGKEIDFIAEKDDAVIYIQVAYLLETEATLRQELAPLETVGGAYPKVLLTLDEFRPRNFMGISHRNIIDFLLGEEL
jgi:hypothetical protein